MRLIRCFLIVSVLSGNSMALASELPTPKQEESADKSASKAEASAAHSKSKKSSAAASSASPSGKDLVVNGSFEYPSQSNGWKNFAAPNGNIYGWRVSSGNVDLFHCKAPDGTQAVDLEGQDAGVISQTLSTEPGAKYEVKFCAGCHPMGNEPIKQFFVRAAGKANSWSIDCTGFGGDKLGWRPYVWEFTAKEPATLLEIGSLRKGGTSGAMIDAVSVKKIRGGSGKTAHKTKSK